MYICTRNMGNNKHLFIKVQKVHSPSTLDCEINTAILAQTHSYILAECRQQHHSFTQAMQKYRLKLGRLYVYLYAYMYVDVYVK